MSALELICYDQERWEESKKLLLQVIEKRERLLGDDHLDTQDIIAKLACFYCAQERLEEAKEFQARQTPGYSHQIMENICSSCESVPII
jgi:hypothetical protein